MDELVNIPALLLVSDGGTQFRSLSVFNGMHVADFNFRSRQIRINRKGILAEDEAFVDSI